MEKSFLFKRSYLLIAAFLISTNAFTQPVPLSVGWQNIHQTGALSIIVGPYVVSPDGRYNASVGNTGLGQGIYLHKGVCAKFLGGVDSDYEAIGREIGIATPTMAFFNSKTNEFEFRKDHNQSGFSHIICISKKLVAPISNDGVTVKNGETTYLNPRLFINGESFKPVFYNITPSLGKMFCAINGHSTFVKMSSVLKEITEKVMFQEYFSINTKKLEIDVSRFDVSRLFQPGHEFLASHIEKLTCK